MAKLKTVEFAENNENRLQTPYESGHSNFRRPILAKYMLPKLIRQKNKPNYQIFHLNKRLENVDEN